MYTIDDVKALIGKKGIEGISIAIRYLSGNLSEEEINFYSEKKILVGGFPNVSLITSLIS